jgi:RimJ/RimL family protein N-acetyltransferase
MLRQPVVELALYKLPPDDWQRVWVMYLSFEPKGQFQGLPPSSPEQLCLWLRSLQRQDVDQFVLAVRDRIVGHSMLCRGPRDGEAELAIFLHQKFRGLGLGRQLLSCTLNYGCKQLGLSRVWLSVQGANPCALHLFESIGFRNVGKADQLTLEMEMERALHCEKCNGEQCAIFSKTLPRTIHGPARSHP